MFRRGYGRLAAICSAAFAAAIFAAPAEAETFPSRPVTIIVPFAAGGGGDILARMIGPKLEAKWGQPIVVENRVGAGGNIGATAAAKATPDGHTLLIAGSPQFAVNVTLFKKLPYDPVTDLTPLAMIAATPFVLVVNPSVPVKSVKEFVDYAKASGKPLSYATAGPGVPHHLYMELLKSMTGVKAEPVPYRGSIPSLNDVVAGHVPVMFVDLGPGLGQIQSGGVRALGVSTAKRLDVLPDVPPVNDTLPGFDVASWQLFAAPSGVPQPILDKLSADIREALEMPEIRQSISKAGMLPLPPSNIRDLQKFVLTEIERWRDVVRKAGIEGSQ